MRASKRSVAPQEPTASTSPLDTATILEATFDAMSDPLIVVDMAGNITRTNTAFRRMLSPGASDTYYAAPLDERMRQIAITDSTGNVLTTDQWPVTRVLRGEQLDGDDASDIQIRTRDGRQMLLNPHGTPLRDAQGAIVGGIVVYHDVTAQRQAESARAAALAQTESEHQHVVALLDVLPAGVAIYDAQGHLIQQNVTAMRLTGRTVEPGEVADKRQSRYGMRHPDGSPLPEPETPSGRARRGQTFTDLTCLITGSDGQDITLLASGAPLPAAEGNVGGAVVVFQDVTALRRLEAEVQVQRNLAEGMLAATPFGVVLFDATDDFRCLRHNAPYLDLLGHTQRERGTVVGEPLAALLAPTEAAQARAIFVQVRDTGQPVVIEEFPATSSSAVRIRWYKLSVSPLKDSLGQVEALLGSLIEITEQVAAREAQRQEAVRLQAVLDVLPTGVSIADADGKGIQVNPAMRQIWGEDIPFLNSFSEYERYQGWWPDGRRVMPEEWALARAITSGQAVINQEIDILAFDGTKKTVIGAAAPIRDDQGAIIGGVSATRDITELRSLERQTHASLNALLLMAQAAVGAGGDLRTAARGIATVTCEVLNCQRVGVMAIEAETNFIRPLAVVGLSPEQETEWWAMQPADARYGEGGDPDQIARFAAGEELVLDMTAPPFDQVPNPFGITTALFVPMRLDSQLVGFLSLDHAGTRHTYTRAEIVLAHGVADLAALVVERERLQAANATAQARALALTETNARMHTFLGIAGHELRTPITSIKTSVQLAARVVQQAKDVELPAPLSTRMDRAAHLLHGVNSQADKLNRFIADLLDVTRIQSGTMEMHLALCDLLTIVSEAADTLRMAWSGRVIHVEIPTDPVLVIGDADRLGQVTTNLLTNALKYSQEDQPIAVRLQARDGLARLEVIDHGPGLTAAQQAHLFQAFGRVAEIAPQSGAGVGLGLGLFICKTIIALHGGNLGVTSQPGQGATFWCTLVLAEGD